jgi:hypothetical protein
MSKKKKKATKQKQRLKRQQKKSLSKKRARTDTRTMDFQPSPFLDGWMPPDDFGDSDALEGFRPISIAQAMMEYGRPLVESLAPQNADDMEGAQLMVSTLWNLAISIERGETSNDSREKVVRAFAEVLEQPEDQVDAMVQVMLDRKTWLFPPDLQPDMSMLMIMRKEERHDITFVTEASLLAGDPAYSANDDDNALHDQLVDLDLKIANEDDGDEWQDALNDVKEEADRRFRAWLEPRVAAEHLDDLLFVVNLFMDFAYFFLGCSMTSLRQQDFEEFFLEFILQKVNLDDPTCMEKWPAALKLFYSFLADVGYVDDAQSARSHIDSVHEVYTDSLRKFYG